MAAKSDEIKIKEEDIEDEEEEDEDGDEEEEGDEEEDEDGEDAEENESGEQAQEQSRFTYRCVICDERFESDGDFHKHRIHHDRCPQCQEIFLCHKELIIHLSLHATEGNICLFCRKISNTKESFEAHLNAHRQHFKTLDCQTCGMKLLTSEEFKIHFCRTSAEDGGVNTPSVKSKTTPKAKGKNAKRSNTETEVTPSKKIKVELEDPDYEGSNGEIENKKELDGNGTRLADRSDIKIENVGPDDEDEELPVEVGRKVAPGGDAGDIKEDPDKPFKCGYCAEPYAESSLLCQHMTQVHPDKLT